MAIAGTNFPCPNGLPGSGPTGMVVAVAWRARYSAGRGWWVAATIGTFIGVIVLHTAWGTFAATLTTHLVIALISLTGLLLATRREVPHA